MNAERVKLWIAALRSGAYKQCVDALCVDDGSGEARYCCLGVGCEVALKGGLKLEIGQRGDRRSYNGSMGGMPESVREFFGHNPSSSILVHVPEGLQGKIPDYRNARYGLAYLNDSCGFSFDEIADCLDLTLELELAAQL